MPTPTYVGGGTFTAGTGALSVPWPAGIADNDAAFLAVNSANSSVATPAGWIAQNFIGAGTPDAIGAVSIQIFAKKVTGAQSNVAVADSGSYTTGQIFVFRGVGSEVFTDITDGNTVWDTAVDASATTAIVCPFSTEAEWLYKNSMVLHFIGLDKDATQINTITGAIVNSTLTGLTKRADAVNLAGVGGGIALITGTPNISTGPFNNTTSTADSSTQRAYITCVIADEQPPSGYSWAESSVTADLSIAPAVALDAVIGVSSAAKGALRQDGSPYIAAMSDAAVGGGGGVTLTWPPYVDGDVAVLIQCTPNTPPAAVWSDLPSTTYTGAVAVRVEYKVATGAQTPIAVPVGGTSKLLIIKDVFGVANTPKAAASRGSLSTFVTSFDPAAADSNGVVAGSLVVTAIAYDVPILTGATSALGRLTNIVIPSNEIPADHLKLAVLTGTPAVGIYQFPAVTLSFGTSTRVGTVSFMIHKVSPAIDLGGGATGRAFALSYFGGEWLLAYPTAQSAASAALTTVPYLYVGNAAANTTAVASGLYSSFINLNTVHDGSLYVSNTNIDLTQSTPVVGAKTVRGTTLQVGVPYQVSSMPTRANDPEYTMLSNYMLLNFAGSQQQHSIAVQNAGWSRVREVNGILFPVLSYSLTNAQLTTIVGYAPNPTGDTTVHQGSFVTLTLPFLGGWSDLAYGNGTYLAVACIGAGGLRVPTYVTSTDGISWVTRTFASGNGFTCQFVDGKFRAAVGTTTPSIFIESADGVSWSASADVVSDGVKITTHEGDIYLDIPAGITDIYAPVTGVNYRFSPAVEWVLTGIPTSRASVVAQPYHGFGAAYDSGHGQVTVAPYSNSYGYVPIYTARFSVAGASNGTRTTRAVATARGGLNQAQHALVSNAQCVASLIYRTELVSTPKRFASWRGFGYTQALSTNYADRAYGAAGMILLRESPSGVWYRLVPPAQPVLVSTPPSANVYGFSDGFSQQNKFICISGTQIYYSLDGSTWTLTHTAAYTLGYTTYTGGYYWSFSQSDYGALRSLDGITWTTVASTQHTSWYRITYYKEDEGCKFLTFNSAVTGLTSFVVYENDAASVYYFGAIGTAWAGTERLYVGLGGFLYSTARTPTAPFTLTYDNRLTLDGTPQHAPANALYNLRLGETRVFLREPGWYSHNGDDFFTLPQDGSVAYVGLYSGVSPNGNRFVINDVPAKLFEYQIAHYPRAWAAIGVNPDGPTGLRGKAVCADARAIGNMFVLVTHALSATPKGVAVASATLTAPATHALSGVSVCTAGASADLSAPKVHVFEASAVCTVMAQASLTIHPAIFLSSLSTAEAMLNGALTTKIPLQASETTTATAHAAMSTMIQLRATPAGWCTSAATLLTDVLLYGEAAAVADALARMRTDEVDSIAHRIDINTIVCVAQQQNVVLRAVKL